VCLARVSRVNFFLACLALSRKAYKHNRLSVARAPKELQAGLSPELQFLLLCDRMTHIMRKKKASSSKKCLKRGLRFDEVIKGLAALQAMGLTKLASIQVAWRGGRGSRDLRPVEDSYGWKRSPTCRQIKHNASLDFEKT